MEITNGLGRYSSSKEQTSVSDELRHSCPIGPGLHNLIKTRYFNLLAAFSQLVVSHYQNHSFDNNGLLVFILYDLVSPLKTVRIKENVRTGPFTQGG